MNKKTDAIIIIAAFAVLAAILGIMIAIIRKTKPEPVAPAPEPVVIETVHGDGFDMDYFKFGHGEQSMVILPGASVKSVMLSGDAVAAAYSQFSEKYTVYVFDVTSRLAEGFTIADMAGDTAQAMTQLGITGADVFGCSLGGMMAQDIAVNHPELVHKLALGSTLSRQSEISTATVGNWYRLASDSDAAALNRDVFSKVYSPSFYEQYADVFASMENDATPEELLRFKYFVAACGSFDIYDRLDAITCPVLVIGSWDDATLSGESCVEIAEKLRCELFMYRGYGHAVYDEAPDYKQHLLDFFAE